MIASEIQDALAIDVNIPSAIALQCLLGACDKGLPNFARRLPIEVRILRPLVSSRSLDEKHLHHKVMWIRDVNASSN
jgi:hypothetical protein